MMLRCCRSLTGEKWAAAISTIVNGSKHYDLGPTSPQAGSPLSSPQISRPREASVCRLLGRGIADTSADSWPGTTATGRARSQTNGRNQIIRHPGGNAAIKRRGGARITGLPISQAQYGPSRLGRVKQVRIPGILKRPAGSEEIKAFPPSVIATRTSAPRSRRRRTSQFRRFIGCNAAANAKNDFTGRAHHDSFLLGFTRERHFITIPKRGDLVLRSLCEALRKNETRGVRYLSSLWQDGQKQGEKAWKTRMNCSYRAKNCCAMARHFC